MKDTELKEARDRDLFLAYQKALRNNEFRNQWEAIEYIRTHPAPRFYISARECSLLLGKMFAGKRLDRMHPLCVKRINELARLYKECVRGEFGEKGMSRERMCEIIVDMPAPEFYVSNRYATRIVNKEIVKHNNRRAEK